MGNFWLYIIIGLTAGGCYGIYERLVKKKIASQPVEPTNCMLRLQTNIGESPGYHISIALSSQLCRPPPLLPTYRLHPLFVGYWHIVSNHFCTISQ